MIDIIDKVFFRKSTKYWTQDLTVNPGVYMVDFKMFNKSRGLESLHNPVIFIP